MARKKALQDDELVRLLDEYRLDNPGIRSKSPNLGNMFAAKDIRCRIIRFAGVMD